jgi:hypothetical protein
VGIPIKIGAAYLILTMSGGRPGSFIRFDTLPQWIGVGGQLSWAVPTHPPPGSVVRLLLLH